MSTARFAWAQSEADRATARNLAAEGYTALRTQDFTTAEDRFRRADALVHAPTLVVDHARALVGLGRYVEAQERLEQVLREGVPENAPWVWKKAVPEAEALLDQVKPKVAWLTIYVKGPDAPLVLVDGVQVPVVALGVRRATDPGTRRISATASGYNAKDVSVTLPEGGERAVTLELDVAPSAPQVGTPTKRIESAPSADRQVAESHSNTLAYVALGVGGAAVIFGTVAGIVSLGARSDLKARCPAGKDCSEDAEANRLYDKYVGYSVISGVSWGVGLASGTAGLWLLLSAPKGESLRSSKHAHVSPYFSGDGVGVVGAF
ncbi:MAG: hypothetical protein QM784_03540 [Polyangiaceae bacterium]